MKDKIFAINKDKSVLEEKLNKYFYSYYYYITDELKIKNERLGEDLIADINNRFYIEKKNDNIIISVKDKGCGIPEEVQKKLFKEMTTTKGHSGSGLGLFMSYSTIKGHFRGNLSFESSEGNGTTFYIKLPQD